MPTRDHDRDAVLVRLAERCIEYSTPFPRDRVVADGLGLSIPQAHQLVARLVRERRIRLAVYGGRKWALPAFPVIHKAQIAPVSDRISV
jgi:hypothetical protein